MCPHLFAIDETVKVREDRYAWLKKTFGPVFPDMPFGSVREDWNAPFMMCAGEFVKASYAFEDWDLKGPMDLMLASELATELFPMLPEFTSVRIVFEHVWEKERIIRRGIQLFNAQN